VESKVEKVGLAVFSGVLAAALAIGGMHFTSPLRLGEGRQLAQEQQAAARQLAQEQQAAARQLAQEQQAAARRERCTAAIQEVLVKMDSLLSAEVRCSDAIGEPVPLAGKIMKRDFEAFSREWSDWERWRIKRHYDLNVLCGKDAGERFDQLHDTLSELDDAMNEARVDVAARVKVKVVRSREDGDANLHHLLGTMIEPDRLVMEDVKEARNKFFNATASVM
jgi:hypothetical protein